MAKNKPVPIPVSNEPDYPPFSEVKERAATYAAERASGMEPMYARCPKCGAQLATTRPEIRSTSYEPTRPVVCPSCGWRDSIAEGY